MISLPLEIKTIKETPTEGTFQIEGLYPHWGITIGNALRRVLLSSLEGAAITYVKIKNAPHEFMPLTGVYETALDIALNLKNLRVKMFTDDPQILTLSVKGEKEVKASDINPNPMIEIINPDLHIANLTDKKSELEIEMTVEKGTGYQPSEEIKKDKLPIGAILLDAIFSPVIKANFSVEDMRLKGRVDYNRLIIEIETDGTICPSEALKQAANILAQHFAWIADEISEKEIQNQDIVSQKEPQTELNEDTKIENLGFSTRTSNALINNGIKTLAHLLKCKKEKLQQIKGLGNKSLEEIEHFLEEHNYSLK